MITLYSYPELYGLQDNNPYGLKVFSFMRICGLRFEHRHILDTASAPRGQLPFLTDDNESIGDSDAIIAHLKRKYGLAIDSACTSAQLDLGLMIRRTLDDLYWVMSYSRWHDDRYWPIFRQALLNTHADIKPEQLEAARQYNFQRYHYQGISRYAIQDVYARGVADLHAISNLVKETCFIFGPQPTSVDAGIYGFLANIYYYEIDTPLKQFVLSQPNLVRHTREMRAAVDKGTVAAQS